MHVDVIILYICIFYHYLFIKVHTEHIQKLHYNLSVRDIALNNRMLTLHVWFPYTFQTINTPHM